MTRHASHRNALSRCFSRDGLNARIQLARHCDHLPGDIFLRLRLPAAAWRGMAVFALDTQTLDDFLHQRHDIGAGRLSECRGGKQEEDDASHNGYSIIDCITMFSKSRFTSWFEVWTISTPTTCSFGSTKKWVPYTPDHPKLPSDSSVPRLA